MTDKAISQDDWESLVDVMRLELQEYGGLIVLLEDQQRGILGRNRDDLVKMSQSIELQLEASSRLRVEREELMRVMAHGVGLDEGSSLGEILPSVPEPVHPLLSALLDGINNMVGKIHRRAQQNRMLLALATEVTEELMRQLQPISVTKTYNHQGTVSFKTTSMHGSVEFSA